MQTTPTPLDLASTKTLIDAEIERYVSKRQQDAQKVSDRYAVLWNELSAVLPFGGKRIRPYMTFLAYNAYAPEAPVEPIIPAALAQELVHAAVLIHDDIIDRDNIRHGVKNIIGRYDDLYADLLPEETERVHMSRSMAIMAGDILLSDAYRSLASLHIESARLTTATDILSTAVFEVVGGELIDTESAFLPAGTVPAETVAIHKTASYSFISPLTMGASLAGADEQQLQLLTDFSNALGIGFQYRDDLIGTFGDEATTGKSTSTDIVEGKRTYLIEAFERLASDEQQRRLSAAFHKADATPEAIADAKQVLVESGAKDAVEAQIQEYEAQARDLASQLTISDAARAHFDVLIQRCLTREY